MLYDPKWEGPSVRGLIGWLETKDPEGTYDFMDCHGGCLISQYLATLGFEWEHGFCAWPQYQMFVGTLIGTNRPWTYGAALKRARKVLEKQT